jgi:hypothetical protein
MLLNFYDSKRLGDPRGRAFDFILSGAGMVLGGLSSKLQAFPLMLLSLEMSLEGVQERKDT